ADNKSLIVTQGMAYDCQGREIVMAKSLPLDFEQPSVGSSAPAWWFDLLIRYDAKLSDEPIDDCLGSERNTVPEQPFWRWSYAGEACAALMEARGFGDEVHLGEEIPLARVRITEQGTCPDFDLTVRRVARSLARPHVATGQTPAGSVAVDGSPLLWKARI